MDFEWKIKGGHRQATRKGYNLLDFNVTQDSRVTVNEDGTITITGKGGFTLALKRFTAKANTKYYIKWELVSGTVDTSKSNGNSFLNPLDNTNIKQGEFKESVVENDKDINGFLINNMAVFTNAVIKFWANTNKNDFEQYGASPSPDYPSEIETVKDSVKIDVINKNLLNIANTEETTKSGITYSIKNGILKLTGTATASFDIQLSKNIKIKKGKYTHSSSYIQSGLYVSFDNLGYLMISATAGKKRKFELTEDTTYKTYFIWIDKGTVLNNIEIKLQLEVAATATDFVEHQSQTITMPIQQEMLEGDYIKDVEHHEWGKKTLNGNENEFLVTSTIGSDLIAIVFSIDKIKHYSVAKIICDMFTTKILGSVTDINNKNNVRFFEGIAKHSNEDSLQVVISIKRNRLESEDLDGVKKWLRINKPTVYYQLATPINLELTAEQQAVRDTKLYTYKNITNIAVSDELASVDISYKKDLDAMFDNIIKQMSSSTSDIAET